MIERMIVEFEDIEVGWIHNENDNKKKATPGIGVALLVQIFIAR